MRHNIHGAGRVWGVGGEGMRVNDSLEIAEKGSNGGHKVVEGLLKVGQLHSVRGDDGSAGQEGSCQTDEGRAETILCCGVGTLHQPLIGHFLEGVLKRQKERNQTADCR